MKKLLYILMPLLFISFLPLNKVVAQDAEKKEKKEEEGWKKGAGLGLDFAQLLQINPKQGAGQNRLGFGGAFNFFANYKKARIAWDNLGAWQFGVQRLGTGLVAQGSSTVKIPFQKAIDELRFNSKVGYALKKDGKLFVAADLSFLSQLTKTYNGTDTYPGNFLSDISGTNASPLSKLFAPATITLSLGLDYKVSSKLSVYFSPLAAKWIVVSDDNIAALNVHGNPVGENLFSALGALARVNYANKFLEDRLVYTSSIAFFSNYKLEPQNIDVDWVNEFGFQIYKGLSAAITLNVLYDHDVKVQVTDSDAIGGIRRNSDGTPNLGRRASITEQFLLKYSVAF